MMRSHTPGLHLILGAALALGACTGNFGEGPPGLPGEPELPVTTIDCTKGIHPGSSPIRRLTRFEYNNTVRDLLGDTTSPADIFPPEEEALGFDNQAEALGVTQLLAEHYLKASEEIAARATLDLPKLLSCDPAVAGQDACAKQFIEVFGKRAYRKPLSTEQSRRLYDVYAWGRDNYDFTKGIALVIEAVLQSPYFLYRFEVGLGRETASTEEPLEGLIKVNEVTLLDPYEMAARLSYLLWGSMPDDELFAAADQGKLLTKEEVKEQAERMLNDPRAKEAVRSFNYQWLGLKPLVNATKDPTIYPAFNEDLRPLLREEMLSFMEQVIFEDNGTVKDLFTASYTMMNAELAMFYGFYGVSGPQSDAFERVPLDGAKRKGLLSQGALMTVYAKPNQSSPVHRGKFVREKLLCQLLPPPPADIPITAPEVDPNATTREKFEEHRTNPACASCHELIDPIGYGFEHYDGIGLWRDKDHGFPVDATGELTKTKSVNGDFDGAIELSDRLSESEEVRQCVATQWFRYGYGHAEHAEDQCTMAELQESFAASGYNIRSLLVALTQTNAFRYRRVVKP